MPLLHPQRLVPLGLAALLLSAAAESRAADRPPLRDADYWAIADRVVVALQPAWDARRGAYVSDWQGAAARTNANMLVVHALAARHHHRGPARADERARRLVDHMTHAPMARHGGPAARHRSVCWTAQLDSSKTDHISVDPQIAEALDEAWSARRALGLSPARRAAIRAVARRCARHTQWRFPYVLLNQINWNAQLYAHLAHLTGHHSLLRHDYRRHLMRFIAAFRRPLPGLRTSNLGPGYGFHYSPYRSPSDALNFDTPEYANLVASAFAYYPRARAAGMRALPTRDLRRVRAWLMRLFAGSWTHAGYLNWDTGYGLARWHSGQYWLSAQQALLMLATVPPCARTGGSGAGRRRSSTAVCCSTAAGRRKPPRPARRSSRSTSSPSTATGTCTRAARPRTRSGRCGSGSGEDARPTRRRCTRSTPGTTGSP